MAGDNVTLGRFQLVGISPAPRGVPQIEVKFDIDANGIVNVTAKDMATGKEQKITITSSSGLSSEEIDRLVKDAEKYAEEDQKKKDEIEVRNQADSMLYQAEKTLNDFKDKAEPADVDRINAARDELKNVIAGDDVEEIKQKTEELMQAIYELSSKMYQDTQEGQSGGSEAKDDVVDADYDVGDETK